MNQKYRLFMLLGVALLLMVGTLLPWAAAPAQALSEQNPTVLISSFFLGGCFEADSATGVPVVKQPCVYSNYSAGAYQGFKLRMRESSRFSIVTNFDTCLGIASGSTADGASLVTTTCGNATSQAFYFLADGDPYVSIRAAHSGKCLSINASGHVVQTSSCKTSAALGITPMGVNMRIKSAWNYKCLDVDNSISGGLVSRLKVQQWDCLGYNQTNQLFHLDLSGLPDPESPSPSGGRHYAGARYYLRPVHSYSFDMLIEPDPAGRTELYNGMPVVQYERSGTWSEIWQLIPGWRDAVGLIFTIKNSWRPGYCLDADTNAGFTNGGKIQVWQCNGWNNQKWIVRALAP